MVMLLNNFVIDFPSNEYSEPVGSFSFLSMVPAMNVSSCIFGGKNLNELYITSACKDLDQGALKRYPLTGGVFRMETKVEGMPTFEFAG